MDFIFLALEFNPIKPDFGTLFWSTIFFLLFWFLIAKFAFKPIAEALKKREGDIQDALDEAKNAREEMQNLHAENERILAEAREERTKILREAKEAKDTIIKQAEVDAKAKAQKIMNDATREIENQKKAAVTELKNQVGTMAIDIAEKVIQKELKGNSEHESFVNNLVNDIKLN